MVVYSKFPIDEDKVRTFQLFLWKDMPGALLPVGPSTEQSWYSNEELNIFRLSSKSHWDFPIHIPEDDVAGDQNSDPFDGDSLPGSAQLLLDHLLINAKLTPSSPGGPQQASLKGDNNLAHLGDPAFDTADFAESIFEGPGNLRVHYVLPRGFLVARPWPRHSRVLQAAKYC